MEILVLKETVDMANRDLLFEMLKCDSLEEDNEDLQKKLNKIPNWIKKIATWWAK